MAKDRSPREQRRGRKLKPAQQDAEEVVEKQVVSDTASQRSRRSKRSSSSKKSKASSAAQVAMMAAEEKKSKKSTTSSKEFFASMMADAGPEASAQASTASAAPKASVSNAEKANIEAKVNAGEFKSEFIMGDDKEDQKLLENQAFKQTAINARGRVHEWADDVELFAEAMLTDALDNKSSRQRTLRGRFSLLKALYKCRDTADCEDDFQNEEFHGQMRMLATIRRKLSSLDSKIGAMMHGAEQSSSDSEGDGEADDLKKLKDARQNLRYSLNPGQFCA